MKGTIMENDTNIVKGYVNAYLRGEFTTAAVILDIMSENEITRAQRILTRIHITRYSGHSV